MAKYLDQTGMAYFWGKLKALLAGKVDTVSGKGLSTEDFTSAEKTKLAAFDTADTYAKKSDISTVYKYKGSVANAAALPSGAEVGDVYNTEDTGMNYAWTGTAWDELGGSFDITAITTGEIDTMMAG